MKTSLSFKKKLAAATFFVCAVAGGALGAHEAVDVNGVVEFEAPTNMPAISVKGKSTAVQGSATVSRELDGLHVAHLEASAPVRSFATGMAVRDEHMRKYIFTTADGQTPDLRFDADEVDCGATAAGQEFTCRISGNLSIRGGARPLTVILKVKPAGGPFSFKATGESVVKLTDYEIPQPTQFGVKVANEVKLRMEFTCRPRTRETSTSGGGR